jgi:hypothetical protein
MNPRNSIWRDVSALNAYAARCQSILQYGQPDADILLYWPIYDRWHSAKGMVLPLTVHARDWLEGQAVGKAAEFLWQKGYAFDYVSDRQLRGATLKSGRIAVPGGEYRAVVVPACEHMPLETLEKLIRLAEKGATVLFDKQMPKDVPGWKNWEQRRVALNLVASRAGIQAKISEGAKPEKGKGQLLVGPLESVLTKSGLPHESMTDQGLMFIRRSFDGGLHYFVANRGEKTVSGWVPLAFAETSVLIMDPMTGRTGVGPTRLGEGGSTEVFLRLEAGESIILRCFDNKQAAGSSWTWFKSSEVRRELTGEWQVKFLQGGPQLPQPIETKKLASWTELGGEDAQRFAGTAVYTLKFDAPASGQGKSYLDLGKVCQSARVRVNGRELGTVFTPPFRVLVEQLQPKDNWLEVEVTNVSANRIRDLDRRKVSWRTFNDINFVSISYKPFDASNWPLAESGLIGPVTLSVAGPLNAR